MQAVILVGVQGAGKSTFYIERFFQTHLRLNLDMLKSRYRQGVLLQACLATGQPFVVDNTNPTIEERAQYIEAARQAGFKVIGYYFEVSLQDCLRRNEGREGKARIPAKGVVATYRRLQPPTRAEGFDELFTVRLGPTGEFEIAE